MFRDSRDPDTGKKVKFRKRVSKSNPTIADYGSNKTPQKAATNQAAAIAQWLKSINSGGVGFAPSFNQVATNQAASTYHAQPKKISNNPEIDRSKYSTPDGKANVSGSGNVAAGDDLITQMYNMIMGSSAQSAQPYSDSQIKQLMSGAGSAGSPFSAQINTIKNQNTGARQDASKGTKKINAMYRALAESDAQLGQQANVTQQDLAAKINASAATGNAENQSRAQELMADNQKYGGDIAAQLNSGIAQQAVKTQGVTTGQAQNFAASALQQGATNQNYFNQNKSADLLEGANRSSDLVSQLQSFLQGNRDKIGELSGQRAAAVQAAKSSALSQIMEQQGKATDGQYTAQQDQISNLFKLMGFQDDKANRATDNQRQDLALQQQLAAAGAKDAGKGGLTLSGIASLLQKNGAFKDKNGASLSPDEILKKLAAIAATQQ